MDDTCDLSGVWGGWGEPVRGGCVRLVIDHGGPGVFILYPNGGVYRYGRAFVLNYFRRVR